MGASGAAKEHNVSLICGGEIAAATIGYRRLSDFSRINGQPSATLYYEPLGLPDCISIPVGAFADPGFPAPTVSVFEARMHAWVVLPASSERIA